MRSSSITFRLHGDCVSDDPLATASLENLLVYHGFQLQIATRFLKLHNPNILFYRCSCVVINT